MALARGAEKRESKMWEKQYAGNEIRRMFSIRSVISMIKTVYPKGFSFSGEMHNFWELFYVIDGKAMISADERVFPLNKGQLVLHKPMVFHKLLPVESQTHCVNFAFDADGPYLSAFADKIYCLDLNREEQLLHIVNKGKKMVHQKNGGSPESYALASHEAAIAIEQFLLDLYGKELSKDIVNATEKSKLYKKIVEEMNRHCCENLSLDQLAALCSMSASSLKKLFKLYNDRGVMKYFMSVKIRRAIRMIHQGMSVQQISETLSFSSQNYFYVAFKREMGMTPAEYKSSLLDRPPQD